MSMRRSASSISGVSSSLQHRDGVDGRERGVPPLGLVVGGDPDQPVGAGLGRHQPVGPRPLDGQGDRLDAGLVALLVVVDGHLEPAPLGPAGQHPPEHLGPVLGLGPAGPGVDGDDRVPVVELPAQQGQHLEVLDGRGQGGQPLGELGGHRVVVLLQGELVQRLQVLERPLEPGHRLEVTLDGGQPPHDPAGPLRVVPQVGRGRLLAQAGQLLFLARQVKGTPSRRRAACAAPPARVRGRWAWLRSPRVC